MVSTLKLGLKFKYFQIPKTLFQYSDVSLNFTRLINLSRGYFLWLINLIKSGNFFWKLQFHLSVGLVKWSSIEVIFKTWNFLVLIMEYFIRTFHNFLVKFVYEFMVTHFTLFEYFMTCECCWSCKNRELHFVFDSSSELS